MLHDSLEFKSELRKTKRSPKKIRTLVRLGQKEFSGGQREDKNSLKVTNSDRIVSHGSGAIMDWIGENKDDCLMSGWRKWESARDKTRMAEIQFYGIGQGNNNWGFGWNRNVIQNTFFDTFRNEAARSTTSRCPEAQQ